jgi:uncharacterized membrane-anchored protein YhcB (DUF1043 family)
MAESTELYALIAEMLGDIGKLHDAVDDLKNVLPSQTNDLEKRITGLVGLLQKAGDVYKETVQTYTNSQGEVIREQLEKDTTAARVRVQQDYNAIVQNAHASVEKTIKTTVQDEITVPLRQMMEVIKQHAWKTIVTGMLTATLTIMIVLGGIVVVYNNKLQAQAEIGRAVMASWEKLDKKAKATIYAERQKE